jgi:NAD(P)H-hydrate epimerase
VIKIVSVEEMKSIEQAADASGHTYDMMMVNAGKSVVEEMYSRVPDIEQKRVVILVGSGNNGGDGLVVANLLAERGSQVAVYMTKERDDEHFSEFAARGLLAAVADQDQRARVLRLQLGSADIVIDAILGTGFQLPLKGTAGKVLKTAKSVLAKRETKAMIVAVDCPSGLDCDTGEVAPETIPADLTVSLAAAKPGLVRFPGAAYVGELAIGEIGLKSDQPELASIQLELAQASTVRAVLPERPSDAHKGTFGSAIVLAGSINYPGAAALAARGAYLSGAGLVTLAVPAPVQQLIAAKLPEVTWILLPHEVGVFTDDGSEILREELKNANAILIGPGFGLEDATLDFLAKVLGADSRAAGIGFQSSSSTSSVRSIEMPASVVDADGLKLLAKLSNWPDLLPPNSVLTPHPGEMQILTGVPKDEIQIDRVAHARQWAETWGHVVLLKGAFTVVAAPDGRATVIPFATPALARAGTGDVLAGIVIGLRAQGLESYEAAMAGAYIHGQAGLIAAKTKGVVSVLAGDVADAIPMALVELA